MCLISGNASLSGIYWLGGSDNALRETYMWESGVAVDSPSHNQAWVVNEPNGQWSSLPQCIGAMGFKNYDYYDMPCEQIYKYVCEN